MVWLAEGGGGVEKAVAELCSDSALSPTVIHAMNHPLLISRDTDHATPVGSFRTTVFEVKLLFSACGGAIFMIFVCHCAH